MIQDVFSILREIRQKESSGESSYDHVDLLIKLKERLETAFNDIAVANEGEASTIPLKLLDVSKASDCVYLELPNGSVVEVAHDHSSIDFALKLTAEDDAQFSLVCDL